MTVRELILRRRQSQLLGSSHFDQPAAVVAWFGAVQAQDYLGALWAVGQRTPGSVESDVELALAERTIVRTWPMRGTLHFVAADDVRWMLELLTPRVVQRHAQRLHREFELDTPALARCRTALLQILRSGPIARKEIYSSLEARGISTAGQRGIHILGRLAQEGLICFGPRAGKQPTFVLLDEWLPEGRGLLKEEALAELSLRYFTGHGPATVRDFAWWSGLPVRDARAGLHSTERQLHGVALKGESYWFGEAEPPLSRVASSGHLLPPFDEYLVGYRDRGAMLDPRHAQRLHALLSPVMELGGKVVGTWRRRLTTGKAVIEPTVFRRLSPAEKRAFARAADHYGRFLGVPASLY